MPLRALIISFSKAEEFVEGFYIFSMVSLYSAWDGFGKTLYSAFLTITGGDFNAVFASKELFRSLGSMFDCE